jgi:long-chain fatty acid transport protein
MNMIGYDAVTSAMGGADVALEAGCTAVAANPANLSTLCAASLAANVSLLSPELSFRNTTAGGRNDLDGESQIFPLPFLGYATKLGDSGWALGLGLFAQGGMGVDFRNVKTNFGTRDDIYSNVRFMRLAPTFAYSVTDQLSIGATFHVGYSDIAFDFFPETSFFDPGADGEPNTADDMVFPGMSMEDARSMGYAVRLGLRYELTDNVAFGATYTSRAELDYDDGDLRMNFSSMGLGKVHYDAAVSGFTWPAAAEIGVAVKLLEKRLTLSGEVQWINWSDALDVITVHGRHPDNAYAPPEVDVPFLFHWDDQLVYSAGLSWAFRGNSTLRLGYNYGEDPVPDENMYPLFPAIVEHHLTLGFGQMFGAMGIDLAYEHAFEKEARNGNADPTQNPFGPDDRVTHSQNTLHISVLYRL